MIGDTDAPSRRLRFAGISALVVLCVLFGGSSRADNMSMLVLRPLAVLVTIGALLFSGRRNWQGLSVPLILLGALAAVIAIQLIPLPPALWSALPGHARFLEAAMATGQAQPWRPISVAPDMTLNSLVALVIPLSLLASAALLTPRERVDLLPVLLVLMIASAVLGIAQWAGSENSPLYPYRQSGRYQPLGFFANRNHQAVFLAMALPLLRIWAVLPSGLVHQARTRAWLAGAAALLLSVVVLATGSRSGAVLAALGGAATLIIAPPAWRELLPVGGASRTRILIAAAAAALVAAVIASIAVLGRAVSLTRLYQVGQVEADLRIQFLPIVLRITRDYLPFGSGFGTFDPVFRMYEPLWALKPTYFNHAHNDILELALTGGIPAVLLLIAALIFVVLRARAILTWGCRRLGSAVALTALLLILIAMAASLTDYPLRTPAMTMVVTLACIWLAAPLAEVRFPTGARQTSNKTQPRKRRK
ncbi:O-antigen ligase family protein [Sphingomonas melonis]|jgi:O-antigen ligase